MLGIKSRFYSSLSWLYPALRWLRGAFFLPLTRGASVNVPSIRINTAAAVAAELSSAPTTAQQLAHGIDCTCYYTENFYMRTPVEAHFSYRDAASFSAEHASLLNALTTPMREELLGGLATEAARRRSVVSEAAARKARVAAEYVPRHPELWTLSERWLHRDFVALVEGAKARSANGALMTAKSSSWKPPQQIERGVYALPLFSNEFCTLLCEELAHFKESGLPSGRPNSMNRYGQLLDELGMSPGFLDPLMKEWLVPLCKSLPPLAAVGGATLDHHKAFVVAYRMGEDEHLSEHFDNSEITLNANLGLEFDSGELVFYGHKESASANPVAYHDWADYGIGHAVLHLGAQVHAALPISGGERFNLVVWMRSSAHRRVAGCPRCGERDRGLIERGRASPAR